MDREKLFSLIVLLVMMSVIVGPIVLLRKPSKKPVIYDVYYEKDVICNLNTGICDTIPADTIKILRK